MDPRLRLAVDTSLAWYEDVFALHGVATVRSRGLWRSLAAPPAYHSVAKTLEPDVPADHVLEAAGPFAECSVADSFGDLHLPGFSLLFEATWLHLPGGSPQGMPAAWSVVSTPEVLAQWCELHDYAGVLPPEVLDHPRFTILGRFAGTVLVGGAVLHDWSSAVDLSNTWSAPGDPLDWGELLAGARAVHPHQPLTAYAFGEDLTAMLAVGFQPLGPQLVWFRQP